MQSPLRTLPTLLALLVMGDAHAQFNKYRSKSRFNTDLPPSAVGTPPPPSELPGNTTMPPPL